MLEKLKGVRRGDTIRPINTRKGEDMNWGDEDDKRVTELRKWLRERKMAGFRKVRTIEEILGECESDLSCRLVTASRAEDGLVVMVEDGTCSQVVSVEYLGQDTNTQEEAGNNKHFIDVKVRNCILVERMREQEMVAGDGEEEGPRRGGRKMREREEEGGGGGKNMRIERKEKGEEKGVRRFVQS